LSPITKNHWYYQAVSIIKKGEDWDSSQDLAEQCYAYGLNYTYIMDDKPYILPEYLRWFLISLRRPVVFISPQCKLAQNPKLFRGRTKYDLILGHDLNVIGINYNCIGGAFLNRWVQHVNRCKKEFPDNPEEWDLYANLLKTLSEAQGKVKIKRLPKDFVAPSAGVNTVVLSKETV